MSDLSKIGSDIVVGTQDVFSTMLMVDIGNEEIFINEKCQIESNLTSMIGLGGGIRGILAVHCPESVAKGITGSFLGMEVAELDEDVKDAIGEIANMIAGNLKVSLAEKEIDIELAIPSSIIGKSFRLSGMTDANRYIVPFSIDNGTFWVELMYVLNV